VAPLVRTGGSRHTGLAAPPHRNIQAKNIEIMILAFQAGRGYQYSVDHQ